MPAALLYGHPIDQPQGRLNNPSDDNFHLDIPLQLKYKVDFLFLLYLIAPEI